MATLDDIAAEAGLSKMTVARILNGQNKEIWPSSAQRGKRVRQIAQRLNYRPNAAAKAIRTGHFGNITLILATARTRSGLPMGLFEGIMSALDQAGLHMFVARMSDQRLTDDQYVPKILTQLNSDGLLLDFHTAVPPAMLELIDRHRVPSVWLNFNQPNNAVRPDDRDAGVRAVKTLLTAGHRRIAFVDWSYRLAITAGTLHYSKEDRMAGYRQAMQEAGLSPEFIFGGDQETPTMFLDRLKQLLTSPGRPSAMICYGGGEMQSLYLAATALGMVIPRDLSAVVFGAEPYKAPGLSATTLLVPDEQVGRRGVGMLLRRMQSPEKSYPSLAVPFEWVEGNSVAAPAGSV